MHEKRQKAESVKRAFSTKARRMAESGGFSSAPGDYRNPPPDGSAKGATVL
jgi:hypothetical protein